MARIAPEPSVVANLPTFFPSYLPEIALPIELQNEPFTYLDNGLRPELRIKRQRFEFTIIREAGAECKIGGRRVASSHVRLTVRLPEKSTSNWSVISVYDNYGLAITYSYLLYLYTRRFLRDDMSILSVYLTGSLKVLRPSFDMKWESTISHVLYLCSQLMRELEHIDRGELRMEGELEDVEEGTLPPEVLSRIIGSRRISKALAEDVEGRECNEDPTQDELNDVREPRRGAGALLGRVLYLPDVKAYMIGDKVVANEEIGRQVRTLIKEGKRFLYDYAPTNELRGLCYISNSPIGEYMRVYRNRGCDGKKSLVTLLEKIRRATNPEVDEDRICRWFMQLSHDLDKNHEARTYNIYQLAEELDELLEMAIELYSR